MPQVEGDQVVSEKECCSLSELVEPRQCTREVAACMGQTAIRIGTHGTEGTNVAAVPGDFQINGDATWR